MAQIQYSPTPSVEPTDRAPDDYQRIDARPEAFGAGIGRGMEALGAGAEKATQFYGQVAADDGTNKFVTEGNKLLYGDPTQMKQQPDGTMGPDTGYFGLKGAEQMAARPIVEQQLEDLRKAHRDQLSTPESQLQFDNYSRRWVQLKQSEIGEKYEGAQREWAVKTHGAEGQIALDDVARHADTNLDAALAGDSKSDAAFGGYVENLKTAYVKQAQAAGGGGPAIELAVTNAVRDAWARRIDALSLNHPIEAQKLAEMHKSDLATEYERVAKSAYERAEQAKGDANGKALLDRAAGGKSVNDRPMTYDPVSKQVVFKDTGLPPTEAEARASTTTPEKLAKGAPTREEAERGTVVTPPQGAERNHKPVAFSGDDLFPAFHGQESGAGANTTTSVDNAHGDMQIIRDTFNRFAKPGERIDNPEDNKRVGHRILDYYAQKYNGDAARVAVAYFSGEGNVAPEGSPTPWLQNRRDGQGTFVSQYVNGILTRLGRPGVSGGPHPVSATSYAGQPVATPGWEGSSYDASAEPAAPASGVKTPDLPAPPALPGTPPAPEQLSPEQVKAKLLSEVENSDWSPQAKRAAKERITQDLATQAMMEGMSQKAKQEKREKAVDGYMQEVLGGNPRPDIMQRIATDPALEGVREQTFDGVARHYSSDAAVKTIENGKGFWPLFQRINLPNGAPGKINDIGEIMQHVGAGGDLNIKGADELIKVMAMNRKDQDQASINISKSNEMAYAKSKLSFDQDMLYPGVRPLKDEKGVQIFEGEFVNKYLRAYDKFVQGGGDPYDFLTRKKTDELIQGLRSKADMDADKIKAMHSVDAELGLAGKEPPPDYKTPEGIQDEHWKAMITGQPTLADGSRSSPEMWVRVLDEFGRVPTEKMAEIFDKDQEDRASKGLGTFAITGRQILAGLYGKVAPVQGRPHTETERYLPHGAGPGEMVRGPEPESVSIPVQVGPFNPAGAFSPALRRDAETIRKKVMGE